MTKEEDIKKLKDLRHDECYVCCVLEAQKILLNYPNDHSVSMILGTSLAALERYDEATQVIEETFQTAKKGELYFSYVTMAFILHQKGSYKEALEWYKKAFKHYDNRPIDLVNCAECFVKQGEYLEAIELLSDPTNIKSKQRPVHFYVLGVAYRAAGKYKEALDCFQKTLAVSRDELDDYELADIAAKDLVKMMRR